MALSVHVFDCQTANAMMALSVCWAGGSPVFRSFPSPQFEGEGAPKTEACAPSLSQLWVIHVVAGRCQPISAEPT